jgi:hypothetical protein
VLHRVYEGLPTVPCTGDELEHGKACSVYRVFSYAVWPVLCLVTLSWPEMLIIEDALLLAENTAPVHKVATKSLCGPGSSDGIATDYGLDCPGIESR